MQGGGIEPVFAVEADGKYRPDWLWLGGQGSVINNKFNAPDGPICSDLRGAGALLAASADFQHSYPHSWRSKAKLIYRCTPQWFIPMDQGDETLRQTALQAISDTRWVPAKAENRMRAMVEGRPDWVISRQRAWGVPIALYVERKSGDYLRDPAVNARILAAFEAGGADAWFGADHQALLGNEYALADYEPVNDILDVWFDSGSTHAFVIEARYGENVRADLYCEGSDSIAAGSNPPCSKAAARGARRPFKAVLTHGFALDQQGKKMSKSIGNTVDPLKVIEESGADILRLWVASTDYFEDVRIGKEVLAGTSDAYRKLRNSFRYLLGALEGFAKTEQVTAADMPELERWVLHRLASLDAELKEAAEGFDFNRYTRLITSFANDDLSAFFFDIREGQPLLRRAERCKAARLPDRPRHDLPRAHPLDEPDPVLHHRGSLADPLSRRRLGPLARMARDRPGLARRGARRQMGRDPRHPRTSHRGDRTAPRDKLIGSSLEAKILYPESELAALGEALADLPRNLHRVRSRAGRRRGDRSDSDRLSQMRAVLALSARGRRRGRPVRALRGGGEWMMSKRSRQWRCRSSPMATGCSGVRRAPF